MTEYESLRKHVGHVGVHIVLAQDGTVEVRCFDRTHGGENHLLLTVKQPELTPATVVDTEKLST